MKTLTTPPPLHGYPRWVQRRFDAIITDWRANRESHALLMDRLQKLGITVDDATPLIPER